MSYERLDSTGLEYLLGKIKVAIESGGGGGGGHTIYDNGTSKPSRSGLNFVGFDVSDNSSGNKTNVSEHELTQSEMSEIMSTLPTPRPIDITSLSGTLAVGHGGTGQTTLEGVKTWLGLYDIISAAGVWSVNNIASVGATSVTITDSHIRDSSTLEAYSENASGTPVAVTQYTATTGQVVLTFPALTEITSFKVKIYN